MLGRYSPKHLRKDSRTSLSRHACLFLAGISGTRKKQTQTRIEVAIQRKTKDLCPNHLPYASRDASPSLP